MGIAVHILDDILALPRRELGHVPAAVIDKFISMTEHRLEELADVGVMPLARHHTHCHLRGLAPTADAWCSCGVEDDAIAEYLAKLGFLYDEWEGYSYRDYQEWALETYEDVLHVIKRSDYPALGHRLGRISMLASEKDVDFLAKKLVRCQVNLCVCHLNEAGCQDTEDLADFIGSHREIIGREWANEQMGPTNG